MATSPRTFVIGDIHGCSMALDNLISSCDPKEADTLVFLGDYVDRGPDSAGVINSILQLIKRCHVIPLLGNHDWMLMASEQDKSIMDFWIQHGGAETLESYGGSHRRIPASHLASFGIAKDFMRPTTISLSMPTIRRSCRFGKWMTKRFCGSTRSSVFRHLMSMERRQSLATHPNLMVFRKITDILNYWTPFVTAVSG